MGSPKTQKPAQWRAPPKYQAFSAWDDFKFTAYGLGAIAFVLCLVGSALFLLAGLL